jgi:hypothetical protein
MIFLFFPGIAESPGGQNNLARLPYTAAVTG